MAHRGMFKHNLTTCLNGRMSWQDVLSSPEQSDPEQPFKPCTSMFHSQISLLGAPASPSCCCYALVGTELILSAHHKPGWWHHSFNSSSTKRMSSNPNTNSGIPEGSRGSGRGTECQGQGVTAQLCLCCLCLLTQPPGQGTLLASKGHARLSSPDIFWKSTAARVLFFLGSWGCHPQQPCPECFSISSLAMNTWKHPGLGSSLSPPGWTREIIQKKPEETS